MAKRHERTLARRSALQVLYQAEILGMPADSVLESGFTPEEAAIDNYARELVLGVAAHKSELDRLIGAASANWAIDRMPVVDRSVLRLAIFEMRYVEDVPASVSINEAVELAKEFGGEDDSHRFVNGVLGRLARLEEGEEFPQAQAEALEGEGAEGEGAVGEPLEDEAVAAVEAAEPAAVAFEAAAQTEGASVAAEAASEVAFEGAAQINSAASASEAAEPAQPADETEPAEPTAASEPAAPAFVPVRMAD